MCEATTLLLISTLFTATAGIQQASAQRAAGRFNQQVAANNKTIADRRADDALVRGAEAEAAQRRKTQQQLGTQKVAFGAGNISLGSGTPLDVLAGTAIIGELDALTIRNNARREALGFRVQAQNFESAGELAAFEAESKARGTLLTTVGSVASKWYSFKGSSNLSVNPSVPVSTSIPTTIL